jgi:hypothetical protein
MLLLVELVVDELVHSCTMSTHLLGPVLGLLPGSRGIEAARVGVVYEAGRCLLTGRTVFPVLAQEEMPARRCERSDLDHAENRSLQPSSDVGRCQDSLPSLAVVQSSLLRRRQEMVQMGSELLVVRNSAALWR